MRNFRELQFWQKSIQITKHIYKISDLLPREEKYGLKSQIYRDAVSICFNIAEGCSRQSESDFKRFL